MPYLRITCPEMPAQRRRAIAEQLTEAVNDLFYSPRARLTREELRERTTVHFTAYRENELFIGARTPEERNDVDLTVELSDWNMSVKQQRRIAQHLTPLLGTFRDPAEWAGRDQHPISSLCTHRFRGGRPSPFGYDSADGPPDETPCGSFSGVASFHNQPQL